MPIGTKIQGEVDKDSVLVMFITHIIVPQVIKGLVFVVQYIIESIASAEEDALEHKFSSHDIGDNIMVDHHMPTHHHIDQF